MNSADSTEDSSLAGIETSPPKSAKSARFAAFPTTRWDLVKTLQKDIETAEATAAFDTLCGKYRQPVYQFLLKSFAHHEAEDVAQEFFLKRAILSNFFLFASEKKGKLRSVILGSLKWHVNSYLRLNAYSERRGGQTIHVSLDDLDDSSASALIDDSDEEFNSSDLAWAREMHEALIAKLRAEYKSAGKIELFEVLSPRIGDTEQKCYQPEAEALGTTQNAAKVATFRMRKRYDALVQKLVADLHSEGMPD